MTKVVRKHIVIPYAPRPLQAEFHRNAKRWNVAICHRRYGKTVLAVCELIRRLLECPHKNPQGAYIANTYSQAKRVAWEYLKEYCGVLPGYRANEAELRIEFDCAGGRAKIYCLGAENYNNLRGLYLDFTVLDEYAQMPSPLLPEVIRPALADRKGGYLIIGTPKGHNILFEAYEQARKEMEAGSGDHYAVLHRASETGILDEDELKALRSSMSEAEYAQELECSFDAAIRGAYYAEILSKMRDQGRFKVVPHDPALRVSTGWDLGMSDSTAIVFVQQAPGGEVRVIDYYEASGEPLSHYVQVLQAKEYVYDRHYLPHDVMVTDMSSGKSRYEMLSRMGLRPTVAAKLPVKDGIEAVRVLLPRCWFDDGDGVSRLVEALTHYRAQWDEKGSRFRTSPVHDQYSHGADAMRTLAVGLRESRDDLSAVASSNRMAGGGRAVVTDYNEFA